MGEGGAFLKTSESRELTMTTEIEQITRDFFHEMFPDDEAEYNYRPDWLKNPKTGKNLELDIFYEKQKLAVEVNGPFHKLQYQKDKDAIKKKVAQDMGIFFLVVESVHDLFKIGRKWRFRIPDGLYLRMRAYKPNRKAFRSKLNNAFRKQRWHKWKDKMSESSRKEKESVLRRMEIRKRLLSEPVHNSNTSYQNHVMMEV